MTRHIVTHGGFAHRDEFLSCCILMSYDNVHTIYRRDPKPWELESPDRYVIDVGRQYDPRLLNFDHHQFHEHDRDCSLSLVLRHIGLYDYALAASPWLAYTEVIDNNGPLVAAKEYGLETAEQLVPFSSPIEKQLLREFSSRDTVYHNERMAWVMSCIGNGLLYHWNAFRTAREDLGRLNRDEYVIKAKGHCWFDASQFDKVNRTALREWRIRTEQAGQFKFVGEVTRNDRIEHGDSANNSYVVRLYPEFQDQFDLRRVGGKVDKYVGFTHRTGFMLVTKPDTPHEAVVEIMRQAAAS